MHRFSKKTKPLHAIVAAAVLAVAVTPLATAGAADSGATTSKVTDAKFKKLKKRIAALEAQGPSPASGPAGGDLAGQFPNPSIRANAVGTDEVEDDSLTQVDIGDNAVGAGEIVTSSIGTDEFAGNVVGNSALKPVVARVAGGTGSNNTFVESTATCNIGEIAVGGGYAWTADTSIDMVASAPVNAGVENNSWVARGRSATANTLFAWVNCLAL
jgi:hypothetical protein